MGNNLGRLLRAINIEKIVVDKINAFDYNRQQEFGDLYAWYKMLIALRKAFPSFGRGTADPSVAFVGENGDCLRYKFGKEEQGDSYNSVCVLLNPFSVSKTLPVEGSGWRILASSSGKDSVNGGNATLAAYSTLILVQ